MEATLLTLIPNHARPCVLSNLKIHPSGDAWIAITYTLTEQPPLPRVPSSAETLEAERIRDRGRRAAKKLERQKPKPYRRDLDPDQQQQIMLERRRDAAEARKRPKGPINPLIRLREPYPIEDIEGAAWSRRERFAPGHGWTRRRKFSDEDTAFCPTCNSELTRNGRSRYCDQCDPNTPISPGDIVFETEYVIPFDPAGYHVSMSSVEDDRWYREQTALYREPAALNWPHGRIRPRIRRHRQDVPYKTVTW